MINTKHLFSNLEMLAENKEWSLPVMTAFAGVCFAGSAYVENNSSRYVLVYLLSYLSLGTIVFSAIAYNIRNFGKGHIIRPIFFGGMACFSIGSIVVNPTIHSLPWMFAHVGMHIFLWVSIFFTLGFELWRTRNQPLPENVFERFVALPVMACVGIPVVVLFYDIFGRVFG